MRYIIHSLFKGPIREYQQGMVDEIQTWFGLTFTKEQGLQPHFTLKYWFETDDLPPLESLTARFADGHKREPIRVGGFDHFDREVIFTRVILSDSARNLYLQFISELRKLTCMTWVRFDAERLHFHSTIAEKSGAKFEDVWTFLQGKERHFDSHFDNISILRQSGYTDSGLDLWELEREFTLRWFSSHVTNRWT